MMGQAAFHAANNWGPVGGRIIASRTTNSTSRIQYADQFGYYATSSLTFTNSTVPTNSAIYQISYSPELNRVVAANAVSATFALIYSDDLGVNWTRCNCPYSAVSTNSKYIPELQSFFSGAGPGSTGSVWKSTDGINWTSTSFSYPDTLFDIEYSPELDIMVGCLNRTATYSMIYSTDRGNTWNAAYFNTAPSPGGPRAVKWIAKYGKFFTVGDTNNTSNNWYGTSTDGINWTKNTFPTFTNVGGGVINFTIDFIPSINRIVICKLSGANQTKPVIYSDDGGSTWVEPTFTSAVYAFYDSFYDAESELLYCVDSASSVVRVTRNGANWWTVANLAPGHSICWCPNPRQIGKKYTDPWL